MPTGVVRAACRGAFCVVLPHPANAYRPYLLRHPVLAFLNALLIVFTVGTTLAISLTPDIARLSTIAAGTLVRLTNAERARAGLPELKSTPALEQSARLKAEHMLRHDYFEHTSPDGLSPWAWFDRASYAYLYAGENLAIDFTDAEGVVTAWVRSPGHRRNLLSDRYAEIGMAVVTGEFQGRTATVVVQHFGSREEPRAPAAPPPPARPAPPPGAVARATTALPRPTATPVPLAAPVILEPTEGARIGRGAATMRGTAPNAASVAVSLDAALVGTYPAVDGIFRGTFTAPRDTEREATLSAVALRGQERSPRSSPRRIFLDTVGPFIAADRALLLPDPKGLPGQSILVVPSGADATRAEVQYADGTTVSLQRAGDVLLAVLPRLPEQQLVLRAQDARGNTTTAVASAGPAYATAAPGSVAPRARVAAAVSRLRSPMAGFLALLAVLLAANILLHLRDHRVLHPDLVAHAAFVLVLGTTLVLLT